MECSPNGRQGARAAICTKKSIRSFPTWDIGGGRFTGVLSIERLAQLSNYIGPPGPAKP